MSINAMNLTDSIPYPGYKITNMPVNLTAWQALKPWSFMTHFGGQTQYSVMDASVPPLVAALAQDKFTQTYNPLLLGFNLGSTGIDPAMVQASYQNAYQYGYNMMSNSMNAATLNSLLSTLSSTESQLSSLIQDKTLTEDQKARLQARLDEVKALKAKVEETIQKMNSMDATELKTKIQELSEELKTISTSIQETTKEIQEELKTTAEGTEGTATEGAEGAATEGADAADDVDGDGVVSPAERKVSKKEKQVEDFVMNQICDLLDNAIDGPGTNYDDDENGLKNVILNNISKDNILELFEKWDEGYANSGSYADDEDGLIETLMDECEGDQKQEIGSMIIEALAERALLNGTNVDQEVAAARKALKSNWLGWRDDDAIQQAVNALKNKVAEGEKVIKAANADKANAAKQKADQKKAAEKTKADAAKAEKAKKQQEKIDAQTALFIKDMKECLERDDIDALPAGVEVVKDASGNFKGFSIRVKGKEYFGKNYLDLAAALEKDGITLPLK